MTAPRPRLTRNDGDIAPNLHRRLVVAAWHEYTAAGLHPATAMAEEAGVPVGTAWRWIGQARRRGEIPPSTNSGRFGQPGRPGGPQ